MSKNIFITGASSGIGKAAVKYFADKGWNVAATMRNPEKDAGEKKDNIKYYRLDVTDNNSIKDSISTAIQDFGGIDVLVNNAGYGAVGAFEKSSNKTVRKQFDVNVFGLMDVTREILPHFREKKDGIIMNISSIGGRMTFPIYSLYNSTKWAVEGFSESLQHELKQLNIKVKLIEPGAIKTDFYDRSQDLIDDYDIPVYDDYEQSVYKAMQKAGEQAPGPEVVAKTMYTAATDKSWRMRYPVGSSAPYLMILRKLLPSGTFNAIVRKVLKA